MKKLLCILFALTAWGHAVSSLAQVRVISRTNDVRLLPTSQDTIYWFTGETVQYDIYARNGRSAVVISNSAVPMWYVTDSTLTNYFVMNTGSVVSATNGQVRFTLTPTFSALTSKLYQSAAIIYFQSPTNPTLQLVVDRTAADVRKSFSYAGTYRGPITSTNWTLDGNTPVFATFWTANATGIFAAINGYINGYIGITNFVFNYVTNPVGYIAFISNNTPRATGYFNVGTNVVASGGGSGADTNSVGRIATNAVSEAVGNYLPLTGGNIIGNFVVDATVPDIVRLSVDGNGVFAYAESGNSTFMLDTNGFTVGNKPFIGSGAGLTLLNSGALTNLGSGLAISGGQLVSTNVSYQLGDIRIYGAATNADATAAIASALAINNSIFIPPGTWTASNIVISGTKTIYGVGYESRLSMAASATGALINAAAGGATVRVRGLSLAGGSEISRATNTAAGSRHGVQYATQDNLGSRFDQMWISGFTGYGIYGNEATYTGNLNDALRISEVTVSNCYGGVVTAGRSELVSVTDCFAGYNAIGFRAGAGNTQIKGCTAANNGIDYDVTATGANDAHGIINDCKAISVPARYTVRVSTNTLGFVFSGNSFYHGGILLESSKGALFIGNQISATFVADRGGGGGTNFFINNVFGTGDANTLSNSAGTIYHVGNFDINGNRMWSETEPLYSLPSSISATQLTAGTIATAIDGRNITNITAASTSGVTSISATGAVSGALTFTGTGVSQSNNVFTFTAGTGGTASASSIVAAWGVNVYAPSISTQAAYIKIGYTNEDYDVGGVYNPTNFNLIIPTGYVSMAISRNVASQNARLIVVLYKNGAEMNPTYASARFFDDVDGAAGSTGGSTHPIQFFNREATNVYSVWAWWNTATRTTAGWSWSGTVQQ